MQQVIIEMLSNKTGFNASDPQSLQSPDSYKLPSGVGATGKATSVSAHSSLSTREAARGYSLYPIHSLSTAGCQQRLKVINMK